MSGATETPAGGGGGGSALSGVLPGSGAIATVEMTREAVNLGAMMQKIGAYRTEDHKYFVDGLGPFPSVTTVQRVMHKPAIEADLKLEVARHALADARSGDLLRYFSEHGEADTVTWLAAKGTLKRDLAASFGTGIHALADIEAQRPQDAPGGFAIPPEAQSYMRAFRAFLDRSEGLQIISSEKYVFNLTEGYAGTYDFLARWKCAEHPSCLWLMDLKTGKATYPDHALQLEAYRRAEFIALANDPHHYPMPWADHVAVLHVRPDKYSDTGYRIIEYVTGDRDWIAFLAALNLFQWQDEKRFLVREGRLKKFT